MVKCSIKCLLPLHILWNIWKILSYDNILKPCNTFSATKRISFEHIMPLALTFHRCDWQPCALSLYAPEVTNISNILVMLSMKSWKSVQFLSFTHKCHSVDENVECFSWGKASIIFSCCKVGYLLGGNTHENTWTNELSPLCGINLHAWNISIKKSFWFWSIDV